MTPCHHNIYISVCVQIKQMGWKVLISKKFRGALGGIFYNFAKRKASRLLLVPVFTLS